jgi:hypothetical protein
MINVKKMEHSNLHVTKATKCIYEEVEGFKRGGGGGYEHIPDTKQLRICKDVLQATKMKKKRRYEHV